MSRKVMMIILVSFQMRAKNNQNNRLKMCCSHSQILMTLLNGEIRKWFGDKLEKRATINQQSNLRMILATSVILTRLSLQAAQSRHLQLKMKNRRKMKILAISTINKIKRATNRNQLVQLSLKIHQS